MVDDLLFKKHKRNKEDEGERMGWKRTCCLYVNWEERKRGRGRGRRRRSEGEWKSLTE